MTSILHTFVPIFSKTKKANCSHQKIDKILKSIQNLMKCHYVWKSSQAFRGICNCTHAQSFQSCPTLCNPMHCSPTGSSVCETIPARTLEWVACPPPGVLSDPPRNWTRNWTRKWTHLLLCKQILYPWATGEAPRHVITCALNKEITQNTKSC